MVFRRPWRYASSSSILMNETLDQPGIGRDLLPRRQMLRSGSRHERGAMTPLSAAARIPAVLAVALTLFASCRAQRPSPPVIAASPSPYLFVWTTDADSIDLNFLAVLDARRDSPSYGRVLATLAVPTSGHTRGHHVEHRMPVGGMLFANDFGTGKTYVLDLRDPLRPAVADSFVAAGDLTSPHSFERLTNGHVLATFQNRGPGNRDVGGIAELDARGRMVRQGSAAAGDVYIRPYSLAVVPALDRVVTGSADMRGAGDSRVVQVWRLSDLTLLRTIPIPNEWGSAAEPRVLADGRTVLVATFGCSLLRMVDLATDAPRVERVYGFAGANCAVPAVVGHFWIQPVPAEHALIALVVGRPDSPREVSRLVLGPGQWPHWISVEPNGRRVVVTGYQATRYHVIVATFDPMTGAVAADSAFGGGKDGLGVSFERREWPHGATGPGDPHGAVFSRP